MGTPTLLSDFVGAVATVAGREHVRLGRNNQDAAAFVARQDRLVLAVTDGCSSGKSSEVGARFGPAWLARNAGELLDGASSDAARSLTRALAGALGDLARLLGGVEPGVVEDHLLFSFLVAVVGAERSVVVGVGDGVHAVNGARVVLDPGPDNAPMYVAYALFGADVAPRVHWSGPTADLRSLALGSDGAAGVVGDLAEHPAVAKNPSLLQKRLNVLARERVLFDDTTLGVLVRRRAE
jgi:hypothetical protein